LLLPALLCLMTTAISVRADNGQESSSPATATERETEDRETEKIVQQLVQAHLPELTKVLSQLRAVQPQEYDRVIKDLARSARKLEIAQNRDQHLFEIEVELLQAEYHASLLTARLKVRDSESDRKQLREAAKRLQHAQIARAEYDVNAFRQRLARSQQQLESAVARLEARKNEAEDQLEKSYLNMLRKAGRDTKRNDTEPPASTKRPVEPAKSTKPVTNTPPPQ
jgi:hypothetical protein